MYSLLLIHIVFYKEQIAAFSVIAAILDLTLRSPRCDVTDLAARPPENKDVILHQYSITQLGSCVIIHFIFYIYIFILILRHNEDVSPQNFNSEAT